MIGSFLVFRTSAIDNRMLAPLFGLDASRNFGITAGISPIFQAREHSPLFEGVGQTYATEGYLSSQVFAGKRWKKVAVGEDQIEAHDAGRRAAILRHCGTGYRADLFTFMPEYHGGEQDPAGAVQRHRPRPRSGLQAGLSPARTAWPLASHRPRSGRRCDASRTGSASRTPRPSSRNRSVARAIASPAPACVRTKASRACSICASTARVAEGLMSYGSRISAGPRPLRAWEFVLVGGTHVQPEERSCGPFCVPFRESPSRRPSPHRPHRSSLPMTRHPGHPMRGTRWCRMPPRTRRRSGRWSSSS